MQAFRFFSPLRTQSQRLRGLSTPLSLVEKRLKYNWPLTFVLCCFPLPPVLLFCCWLEFFSGRPCPFVSFPFFLLSIFYPKYEHNTAVFLLPTDFFLFSSLQCTLSESVPKGQFYRSFSRTATFQLSNESVDSFYLNHHRPMPPSHSLLFESISDFYDSPSSQNLGDSSVSKTPAVLEQLTDMTRPPMFLQGPILSVFTAELRAAGTAATPHLRIVGENGELECSLNGTFSRGSRSLFSPSLEDLGKIESIVVSTEDDSSLMPSNRWLLEKIVLSLPNRGDVEFVCNEWIGSVTDHEEDDLVHENMVLFPASDVSESHYEW